MARNESPAYYPGPILFRLFPGRRRGYDPGLDQEGGGLAEKHDLQGLLALTSGDFVAFPGRHNRQETKGILWMAFRHYGPLQVLYPQPSIDLDPAKESALVTIYFIIVKKELSYPGLEALYAARRPGWPKPAKMRTCIV